MSEHKKNEIYAIFCSAILFRQVVLNVGSTATYIWNFFGLSHTLNWVKMNLIVCFLMLLKIIYFQHNESSLAAHQKELQGPIGRLRNTGEN